MNPKIKEYIESLEYLFTIHDPKLPDHNYWTYIQKCKLKISKNHENFWVCKPLKNRKEIVKTYAEYFECSLSESRQVMNYFLKDFKR